MAAKPKEYQRLPGRGRKREGFVSFAVSARRTRLWLGRDHLLAVEAQWYAEDYRRFYFRDIQAFIVRKTTRGRTTNLVLAFPAILFLAMALSTTGGLQVFWGILSGVLVLFLLANTLAGPTCVCQLQTAVQTEEMPSLQRLRRARKVTARVRPFIIAAQGQLTPEEIAARLGQPAAAAAPTATATPPPDAPPAG
jgi:hypothetical protein